MTLLKYYFFLEFNWNNSLGFSELGIPKAKFLINPEYCNKHGHVSFEILESMFSSNDKLKQLNFLDSLIEIIQKILKGELEETEIFCESESLEIKKQYSRPIDNLDMYGSNPPSDGPNSWNITTPKELQYIPTKEIIVLFIDWRSFLFQQKKVSLQFNNQL